MQDLDTYAKRFGGGGSRHVYEEGSLAGNEDEESSFQSLVLVTQ